MSGSPVVAGGVASLTGRRADNQDFAALYEGSPRERAGHGLVAVLADGVGGAKGGRVAAELACRSFIDFYYSQPETLGVAAGAERAIQGFNRWLHAIGTNDPGMAGAATTFAAFVLRGRQAHALHVGDSRAWHFRDGVLTQLTNDHSLSQPGLQHVLYRAVGIEPSVRLDHRVQPLALHDRLLLTSDGVHGALPDRVLARLLGARGAAGLDAEKIVRAALEAGSSDNVTAVVLDVVGLPDADHAGVAALARDMAVPAAPNRGESVDGFLLERQIWEGRYSRVFLARLPDAPDNARYVLKFPKPGELSVDGARLAFVREMVIGAQVRSPYVAEVIALAPDRQSRIYVAMPFYAGETLEMRLKRGRMEFAPGLRVAAMLARAVVALHRRGIVHRDIKPENVLLVEDGGLRLLDLGVARLPHLEEFSATEIPGTPGYLAPELYAGGHGDEATDQFALGVTLYRMFTGGMPFGHAEPLALPGFGAPADPAKLRADMPGWLALALRRAVQPRPEDRFGDVTELLLTLEGGSARAAPTPRRRPLLERNPALFWKIVAGVLLVGLVGVLLGR